MGIRQQAVVAEHFRHYGQRVNDRTETRGPTDTEGPGHARRTAALKVFSKMRDTGDCEFGGRFPSCDRRMRGNEQRNPGNTIVKVWSQADELEDFCITEPVQANPCGTRPPANGTTRQFLSDPVRFGSEGLFCQLELGVRWFQKLCLASCCDIGRLRQ